MKETIAIVERGHIVLPPEAQVPDGPSIALERVVASSYIDREAGAAQ
ncbi:MAG: hypothetical protein HY320_06675 [Armatimonadetes bacterium]|nr:hypothetical protein [Armatimonadota bacterium]